MNSLSDFVQVELSAAGVAFAGKAGTVRIAAGHFDYSFATGKPVRVLTSEWSRTLSKRAWQGKPILQVAQTAPTAPKPNPAPSAPAPAQPNEAQEKGK